MWLSSSFFNNDKSRLETPKVSQLRLPGAAYNSSAPPLTTEPLAVFDLRLSGSRLGYIVRWKD